MSTSSLAITFHSLKYRILAIGGVAGFAWGCCAAMGLLLVGAWLDLVWELSPFVRLVIIAVSIAIGLFLTIRVLVAAIARTRDAVLARRLDESGSTGGEIVSGFELQASRGTANVSSLTYVLAEMAVMRAASLAAQIPQVLAAPTRPALGAIACIAGLFAGTALMFMLAPRLATAELRRFVDPWGDHPPFSYTIFQVEPGDTRVRYGDGLDVYASTEGPPVEELDLIIISDSAAGREEKLPMFPESPKRWRATVSSVTSAAHYFVRSRTARSARYRLDLITVPELGKVRFRVTPPVYTRDAAYEGVLPQGGLSGLAGTIVEVTAQSNRPLSSGSIELVMGDEHQKIPLEPAVSDGTSHEVSGQFRITKSGTFQLKVTDVDGQESRDSMTGLVNLLKDQSPFVRLLEPVPQSLATPSVILPVVVAAEDDYGITKLQLFRSLNDSRATPLPLPTESPPSRRHEESTRLPFSAYGLKPGDVIKLFARVEDNDPNGAKGSESPIAVIQIVADEDFQRMLRAREGMDVLMAKYQEAERRMESLIEEIEQLQKQLEKRDADGELSSEEKEQIERLAKRIDEQAEAVRESAKHVTPYDLDQSLNGELEKLADNMDEAAEEAEQAASDPNSSAGETAEKIAEIKKKLVAQKKELQEGVTDPLERLAKVYPLMEDQSRFAELANRQRDLSDRLNSLKEQENPDDPAIKARMRDLEAEQARNKEDLEKILSDIENHAQQIPEDDPKLQELAQSAREFVQAVRESEANAAMAEAEAGLAEFSGSRGHGEAKNAADILDQFVQRSEANGNQAGQACENMKFQPGDGALGNTLQQLLADAGMNPGNKPGMGMGTGGGYSARRSSLSNIGLYGDIPTRGNPTQSKNGGGKKAQGGVGGSFRTTADGSRASQIDPHGMLKASGASETSIPARYRGRVEEYFRRIAEETSGKK